MKVIREGGLSRLWQHTKDGDTFAIIGSIDKDTEQNRYDELIELIRNVSSRYHLGSKHLKGTYTYKSGKTGTEDSIIIYGIPKWSALSIGEKINQESIIWKDDSYFGFLTPDGKEDGTFVDDPKNMSFDAESTAKFGSKLAHARNKNAKEPFLFKMECVVPDYSGSSIRHLADKYNTTHNEIIWEGVIEAQDLDEFKERPNSHQTH